MTTHRILGWNIEKGGYHYYHENLPPNNPSASELAKTIEYFDANTVVISDAQGMADSKLQKQVLPGYPFQSFTYLNDSWLLETDGENRKHVGVHIATKEPVAHQEAIDLGTRQGNEVVLDIGKCGLRISGLYLNHFSEKMRTEQIEACLAHLNRSEEIPTVVVGDLNTQRPLENLRPRARLRSSFVKMAGNLISLTGHPAGEHLLGLERRQALKILEENSFVSAATNEIPTALLPIAPFFQVDHIYTRGAGTANYTLYPTGELSDHKPISADVHFI